MGAIKCVIIEGILRKLGITSDGHFWYAELGVRSVKLTDEFGKFYCITTGSGYKFEGKKLSRDAKALAKGLVTILKEEQKYEGA
jgi:hypothetical protein